jgi:hypothetical protein
MKLCNNEGYCGSTAALFSKKNLKNKKKEILSALPPQRSPQQLQGEAAPCLTNRFLAVCRNAEMQGDKLLISFTRRLSLQQHAGRLVAS